jgi:hypothetical protein
LQKTDALKILHSILVHVYLKTATTKIKHLQIWLQKQIGKNSYQNADV